MTITWTRFNGSHYYLLLSNEHTSQVKCANALEEGQVPVLHVSPTLVNGTIGKLNTIAI
jgi:hypothetical protein